LFLTDTFTLEQIAVPWIVLSRDVHNIEYLKLEILIIEITLYNVVQIRYMLRITTYVVRSETLRNSIYTSKVDGSILGIC